MNKQFAKMIISAIKVDLEFDDEGGRLYDDMCRAEKLFGKEIPEIVDCLEEVRSYGKTIYRNGKIIVDLLEMRLVEQEAISFDLKSFYINDDEFNKLIEKSFQLYKETKFDIATEKIWDAYERIKTYYSQLDTKGSAIKLIDVMGKNNVNYVEMLNKEFKELTDIGNEFSIRHHNTKQTNIDCKEHYVYLFHRCLSVLTLVTTILNETNHDEVYAN